LTKKVESPKISLSGLKMMRLKITVIYVRKFLHVLRKKKFTSIHIFIYSGWMKTNGRSPNT
jgi:hypothetical protein